MKTTAREFLVGKGLAKAGRGKFSNAAKAALAEAMDSGVEFSDYTGGPTKPKDEFLEVAPRVHPEHAVAHERTSGRKVSMKGACNSCGYSLGWCQCQTPTVNMKVVVISAK